MTSLPGVKVFKALADENRLRAAAALLDRELCVCQISELLGLAPSTISKHMTILKDAGIVVSTKRGRWVFYRISRETPSALPSTLLPHVLRRIAESGRGRNDVKRLAKILEIDPEILCERQRKC
jgi:DNA-binding transcriptional ArsR family regulator